MERKISQTMMTLPHRSRHIPFYVPACPMGFWNTLMFIPDKREHSTLGRLRHFRKKLIKEKTLAEIRVQNALSLARIEHKFQYVIPPYIVDFYLPTKGLVLEIDGGIHNVARVQQEDYRKENYLLSLGIVVLRYKNQTPVETIIEEVNTFREIHLLSKMMIDQKLFVAGKVFSQHDLIIERPSSYEEILEVDKSVKRLRDIRERFKSTVEAQGCKWEGFRVYGFKEEYAIFYDPVTQKRIEINIIGATKYVIKATIAVQRGLPAYTASTWWKKMTKKQSLVLEDK